MINSSNILLGVFMCCVVIHQLTGQNVIRKDALDVLSYHVQLKPNIPENSIEGNVLINFSLSAEVNEVVFNCGNLLIVDIEGGVIESYAQKGKKLIITLSDRLTTENKIRIFYRGNPSRGVAFFTNPQQMYTVFFTSEWMICNDSPNDRASIKIDLLIPDNLMSIANGVLISKEEMGDNITMYSWDQNYETPTYTYGFAIGSFNTFQVSYKGVLLNFYSHNYSFLEMEKIFDKTSNMLAFFEDKSGVPYNQKSYSQILIGDHYQEMSGVAVLKESYGQHILEDSTEINLIAHELAHQWWGNMITCKNWNNIWLNEGFATFMSAAYNEHRFGKLKYQANISAYYEVYESIKNKGADKSLVFEDWSNATSDDRSLVYFKGAYVLHLLRVELGEEDFWKGIKAFSQQYYGKSVTTRDLQLAMENVTNRNLNEFFEEWVY